MIEIY